jgi:hypothetical protein
LRQRQAAESEAADFQEGAATEGAMVDGKHG